MWSGWGVVSYHNTIHSFYRNTLYYLFAAAAAAAKPLQSCPTLCDPIDDSPPGSPVPRILQARTLEWVAISFSNAWKWKVKMKSLSRVQLLVTPWTTAHQAPPSMGFSRQEYWSGVHCLLRLPAWFFYKSKTVYKVKSINLNVFSLRKKTIKYLVGRRGTGFLQNHPQQYWKAWVKHSKYKVLRKRKHELNLLCSLLFKYKHKRSHCPNLKILRNKNIYENFMEEKHKTIFRWNWQTATKIYMEMRSLE